jgi:hypothetical protein
MLIQNVHNLYVLPQWEYPNLHTLGYMNASSMKLRLERVYAFIYFQKHDCQRCNTLLLLFSNCYH